MVNGLNQNQVNPAYGSLKDVQLNVQNFDTEEAKQKATSVAKDSWVGSVAGGVVPKETSVKKVIFSVLGTALMVFGIAKLGRNTEMFKKVGDFGDKIAKNKTVANIGEKISGFFKGAKAKLTKSGSLGEKISDKFKAIFTKNADDTTNALRPKNSFVRPMVFGTKNEVVDNVIDPIQYMLKGNSVPDGRFAFLKPIRQGFKKLMEGPEADKIANTAKFKEMLKKGGCSDVEKFCDRIKNFGGDVDERFRIYKEMKGYLTKSGIDLKGSELFTQKAHGFKVGFLDSIKRAEIINNTGDGKALYGAKTGLGRTLQKGLFRGMEAPSNGVASRTAMGFGIAVPIYWSVFNKVFDAPKKDKFPKFAEESVTDMGQYMMMPIAAGSMYAAASLKYFGANKDQIKTFKDAVKNSHSAYKAAGGDKAAKDKAVKMFKDAKIDFKKTGNLFERILRKPAEILGMGLEGKPGAFLSTKAGGVLRVALYMGLLAPFFIKPIKAAANAIFGKPSDTKAEEDAEKAKKAAKKAEKLAKKNGVPPINMTPEELLKKLEERPELVAALQNDPKMMAEIQKNPEILFKLIEQTPPAPAQTLPTQPEPQIQNVQNPQTPKEGTAAMSPALQQMVKNHSAAQTLPTQPEPQIQNVQNPQTPEPQPETPQPQQSAVQPQEPVRTYVPSSTPVAKGTVGLTSEQQNKMQSVYEKADKAEAEARKYL